MDKAASPTLMVLYNVYEGEWKDGKVNGQGRYTYPDRTKFVGSVHLSITCDGCSCCPVLGQRFKCSECDDFDLCEACYTTTTHGHDFILISAPTYAL